jgi:uncharacterized protein YndB with AHSA1/START domain
VIVTRSRTVAAPLPDVWAVVGDPFQLPRWWPLTERVESVDDDAWTSVLRSDRGRAVRADYQVEAHEPPRRRAWAQQLAGTPFEKVLRELRTEVALAESGPRTEVTLTVEQRARGTAKLGGLMLRRATRRRLDAALDGLEAVLP